MAGACSQLTHSDSLGLTVDLERTEAFWEIELLKMNGRWATLSLLKRTTSFPSEQTARQPVRLHPPLVSSSAFTSSSKIRNSNSSFWSLRSWMSFRSCRSSNSICFIWSSAEIHTCVSLSYWMMRTAPHSSPPTAPFCTSSTDFNVNLFLHSYRNKVNCLPIYSDL